MEQKKILLAIHELTYTGSVYCALRICQVLLKHHFQVDVWSYDDGPFRREFLNIGIAPRLIGRSAVYESPELERQLWEYDLLIANTISTYEIADMGKNILPTVWYIHEAQNLPWQFFKSDIRQYFALLRAENLYAVSEYARDFIEKEYGLPVRVLHNCVEDRAADFSRSPGADTDKVRFLALGTVEARKAFDAYLNAYLALSEEERSRCEVHFAGRLLPFNENYYTPLLKLAETHDGIHYHGEIRDRDVLLQLMMDSDVVVVPSLDESCSMVALEGAMMGKPLILSENVGAKYLLTEQSGWSFQTGNAEALRDVFRAALKKKDALPEMGRHAREKYLETSTFEIYEKNVVKMAEDNLVPDREAYRAAHEASRRRDALLRAKQADCEYLFHEEAFPPGSSLAIYAAGKVGQSFFAWVARRGCIIRVWVDQNWEALANAGLPVEPVERLPAAEYDQLCIAVQEQALADAIRADLLRLGLDETKIIWARPLWF